MSSAQYGAQSQKVQLRVKLMFDTTQDFAYARQQFYWSDSARCFYANEIRAAMQPSIAVKKGDEYVESVEYDFEGNGVCFNVTFKAKVYATQAQRTLRYHRINVYSKWETRASMNIKLPSDGDDGSSSGQSGRDSEIESVQTTDGRTQESFFLSELEKRARKHNQRIETNIWFVSRERGTDVEIRRFDSGVDRETSRAAAIRYFSYKCAKEPSSNRAWMMELWASLRFDEPFEYWGRGAWSPWSWEKQNGQWTLGFKEDHWVWESMSEDLRSEVAGLWMYEADAFIQHGFPLTTHEEPLRLQHSGDFSLATDSFEAQAGAGLSCISNNTVLSVAPASTVIEYTSVPGRNNKLICKKLRQLIKLLYFAISKGVLTGGKKPQQPVEGILFFNGADGRTVADDALEYVREKRVNDTNLERAWVFFAKNGWPRIKLVWHQALTPAAINGMQAKADLLDRLMRGEITSEQAREIWEGGAGSEADQRSEAPAPAASNPALATRTASEGAPPGSPASSPAAAPSSSARPERPSGACRGSVRPWGQAQAEA